jgi:CubicO group peptidase (beta-lactamase class C family)
MMNINRRFVAGAAWLVLSWGCVAVAAAQDPLPRARAEQVGMSSERLARLTAVLHQYVADEKIAGSVVLIARRGKLVYFEGIGERDREAHAPMQTDALFRIASQSKALISTGILMLQEEGKLLISDPLEKYLPEFHQTTVAVPRDTGGYDVVPAKRAITLRDLLTHTSGIGYGNGVGADAWRRAGIQNWYFADRNEPIAATVSRMAALPFEAQPGEKWVYGYSVDILGVVIERASGMPLDQFMRTKIFAPLGMNDTAFYVPPEKRNRLATVYSLNADNHIVRAPDAGTMESQGAYVDGPRMSFSGGAGLTSTAADYGRFLQMMLNGGVLDGHRILSRKTVELMTTDNLHGVAFRPGQGFGLGFDVAKDVGERGMPSSVGEFGWGGAYHSTYWVDPHEGLVVVYLAQLLPSRNLDDHAKLRALIYQAIVD